MSTYLSCCKTVTTPTPTCSAQPSTNYTFMVTIGKGSNGWSSTPVTWGFSEEFSYGSINLVGSSWTGIREFWIEQWDGGTEYYFSFDAWHDPSDEFWANGISELWIDGVNQDIHTGGPYKIFNDTDIGKTFCISLIGNQNT